MPSTKFDISIYSARQLWCGHLKKTLQWRHNERNGVSNRRRLDCLLNSLSRRRSKKHQGTAPLVFVRGIHRYPLGFPHKVQVTWKILPFDDVMFSQSQRVSHLKEHAYCSLDQPASVKVYKITLRRLVNTVWLMTRWDVDDNYNLNAWIFGAKL